MDLIGSVLSIENRLGKRKSSEGKIKPAQKRIHAEAPDEAADLAVGKHVVPEYGAHIGRIVDTTA